MILKTNRIGGITPPDFRIYYNATATKMTLILEKGHTHRLMGQNKRTEIDNAIEKWAKDLNRHHVKKEMWIANKHGKRCFTLVAVPFLVQLEGLGAEGERLRKAASANKGV